MSDQQLELLDFGPRELLISDEQQDAYCLSKEEWIKIQVFVNNGIQLPINDVQFNEKIENSGGTAQTDMSDFQKLIRCYQDINTHCLKWRDEIFDEVVNLADDVVHYGKDAEFLYGGIITLVDRLKENPNDQTVLGKLDMVYLNLLVLRTTGNLRHLMMVGTE